jgi:hypothetical protein
MTYKSGKYKDMLSPDRSTNEIPAGERKMVQALIDETYQKFKAVVSDGRSKAHEKNLKEGKALADNWQDSRTAAWFPARRRSSSGLWMNSAILTTR